MSGTLTQPTEAMVETVARGEHIRVSHAAAEIAPAIWGNSPHVSWEALEQRKRDAYLDRARVWLRIALPLVTEAMVIERMRAISEEEK